MYDLVVVGGGPGGYEAAAHAGRLGKNVALVEEAKLGGTCLNVGCIPAKSFLRSSRLYHEVTEAKVFGVDGGVPRFDLSLVAQRKERLVATLSKGVVDLLGQTGVEVVPGHARLRSAHEVEVGGSILHADNVLLATGSRALVPPVPGMSGPAVVDSSAAFHLTNVPSRVAVIGGGYIGLEFASFFRGVGSEVSVFEMLPTIAAGCDSDISQRLLVSLRRSGIAFNLSCRVTAVEGANVTYINDRGETEVYSADCVLNATGRAPLLADLGLEDVGVDFTTRGITIDDQCRTNVPGLWAAGDVTGRQMLAHLATRQGMVAVNNMFGVRDRVRYDTVPAVIYTHPEAASVGYTETQLKSAGVSYQKAMVPMGVAARSLIEEDNASGFVKVLAGGRHGEILGVHAVGDWASEWISAAVALVTAGTPVSRAAQLVFPHPTISEALREAILRLNQEHVI